MPKSISRNFTSHLYKYPLFLGKVTKIPVQFNPRATSWDLETCQKVDCFEAGLAVPLLE